MDKETEEDDRDFCEICQKGKRAHMTHEGEERV